MKLCRSTVVMLAILGLAACSSTSSSSPSSPSPTTITDSSEVTIETTESAAPEGVTSTFTAEVWAEHSIWPQDLQFSHALAGGVTSMQVLPGSANLFGGRSVILKNVWSRSVQGMKFPGAKYGMKMSGGENPMRVCGEKNRTPSTHMANFAGYRAGWIKALEYQYEWDQFTAKRKQGDPAAKPPKRDLELETLAAALRGDILLQMHCYRADEMM